MFSIFFSEESNKNILDKIYSQFKFKTLFGRKIIDLF